MASGAELALQMIMSLKDEASGKLKELGEMAEQADKKAGGLGETFGKLAGIGKGVLLGGIGLATGAIAGIGTAAFAAGVQMDDAMDTMAIATGATGEALDALGEDFKAVFTSIPTEAGPAADAIAELNRRTGMTGETLQETAKPLLEMTRLLGGDAKTNTALFTRVMGDWGISNEDAAGTLDKLFVAGQQTGASVEGLMQKVVQFGSPLRLMGFSLEDSIALFAKWEKEGVNAELVMGSLRIAAGKFAKDNIPLQEGLQDTIAKIQGMENASEALALGMSVFGARAGPDMVAAIREGRFSADELITAMQGAEGAILATADATADFPEKMQVLKNVTSTALAPLGLAMMDIVTTMVERLSPALINLAGYVQPVIDIVVGLIDTLIMGEEPMGDWGTWWETMAGLLGEDVANAISGVVVWIQEMAKVVGDFMRETLIPFVQEHLEGFKGALIAIGVILAAAAIVTGVIAIAGAIAALANPITAIIVVVGLLGMAWGENWGGIQEKTAAVLEWLGEAWETLKGGITALSTWLTETWGGIAETVTVVWGGISEFFTSWWEAVEGIFSGAFTIIQGIFTGNWEHIEEGIEQVWGAYEEFFTGTWERIQELFRLALEALGINIDEVWKSIAEATTGAWDFATGIGSFLFGIWETIKTTFSDALTAVWRGIGETWKGIFGSTTDAWQTIVEWMGEKVGGIWANAIKPGLDLIWENFRTFWTNLFDNIHIKTPHFKVKWQDVFGVNIPVGVSVSWYGMGGDFITNGPMLIGVGERGPERVQITPMGKDNGSNGGGGGATYQIVYHDHRLSGEVDLRKLLEVAERLEWRARMRR